MRVLLTCIQGHISCSRLINWGWHEQERIKVQSKKTIFGSVVKIRVGLE